MERAEGNREDFNFNVSRDMLHKIMKRHRYLNENEVNGEDDDDDEIELNLGLSMNGRFGVDPSRKKLKRSSSIANLVFTVGAVDDRSNGHHARGVAFDSHAPLMRARSLPAETEEEWRRRKELESMRRMEARKKRMEKLKNVRVVKDNENCFEDVVVNNGSVNGQRVLSQGSIGSSGTSDVENQQIEGGKQNSVAKSPSYGRLQEQGEQESAIRAGDGEDVKGRNEVLKNTMLDMPHVTTKEDGPNGNKIEGFLYRYKKGEEVKIVCVCHGAFLSPAEFVKHGGGGDVEQPLKHIVVNAYPLS
ncbi:hypothetical protein BUALT_Bualt04G0135800 [Buddleja alternifolia]|uniref:Ninja-family protein n=1 Tax=Buddleja alternifolia TaxID=168488 RepID=A0AAV6XZF0_9LAMI|nr:hypothetical protein BUALT_Bualt04G0135800 [Buddleja alternifolia]